MSDVRAKNGTFVSHFFRLTKQDNFPTSTSKPIHKQSIEHFLFKHIPEREPLMKHHAHATGSQFAAIHDVDTILVSVGA